MDGERTHVSPRKLIEQFSDKTCETVAEVLKHDSLNRNWPAAWAAVADDRIALADAHLAAAVLVQQASRGSADPNIQRAVISRAYYAMFCAARGALSLETNGDVNAHTKVADILKKSTSLKPSADREAVVSALSKFRILRNEADYSAYYPASLDRDAIKAVESVQKVLRICRAWVQQIKKTRGLT